jgi:hypothetical protein
MCSFSPISVVKMSVFDLANKDLSNFDCLYFVGLPVAISSNITQRIATFVNNGGGLVLEYPNNSHEYINVLSDIESLYCYSNERLLQKNAYWTIDGGNSYIFDFNADISFMSTFRQIDFSTYWTILMTNIQNIVTTTTTTAIGDIIVFDNKNASEFVVSFISSAQNGIITIEPN